MPLEMPPQTPQQKADEIFATEKNQNRIEVQVSVSKESGVGENEKKLMEDFVGKEVNGLTVLAIVPALSKDTSYQYFYVSLESSNDANESLEQKISRINGAFKNMEVETVDQTELRETFDQNPDLRKKAPYIMGTKTHVNKLGNTAAPTINPLGQSNAFELSSGEGTMFATTDYIYVMKKKIEKPTTVQFPSSVNQ